MAYDVEVTDTFGGEANYCWVRRYVIDGTGDASNHTLVRRAKKAAGWSRLRCSTDDYGDSMTVRPVGRSAPCWIMFISWRDAPDDTESEES